MLLIPFADNESRKKQRKSLTNIVNFVQLQYYLIDLSSRHANNSHVGPGSFIQLRQLISCNAFSVLVAQNAKAYPELCVLINLYKNFWIHLLYSLLLPCTFLFSALLLNLHLLSKTS